jgi:hypothetical protein
MGRYTTEYTPPTPSALAAFHVDATDADSISGETCLYGRLRRDGVNGEESGARITVYVLREDAAPGRRATWRISALLPDSGEPLESYADSPRFASHAAAMRGVNAYVIAAMTAAAVQSGIPPLMMARAGFKLTRTQLDAVRRDYAGVRSVAHVRDTGALAVVYDAHAAGLDECGGRYAVVCETHGAIVNVRTLRDASRTAAVLDHCETCETIRASARRIAEHEATSKRQNDAIDTCESMARAAGHFRNWTRKEELERIATYARRHPEVFRTPDGYAEWHDRFMYRPESFRNVMAATCATCDGDIRCHAPDVTCPDCAAPVCRNCGEPNGTDACLYCGHEWPRDAATWPYSHLPDAPCTAPRVLYRTYHDGAEFTGEDGAQWSYTNMNGSLDSITCEHCGHYTTMWYTNLDDGADTLCVSCVDVRDTDADGETWRDDEDGEPMTDAERRAYNRDHNPDGCACGGEFRGRVCSDCGCTPDCSISGEDCAPDCQYAAHAASMDTWRRTRPDCATSGAAAEHWTDCAAHGTCTDADCTMAPHAVVYPERCTCGATAPRPSSDAFLQRNRDAAARRALDAMPKTPDGYATCPCGSTHWTYDGERMACDACGRVAGSPPSVADILAPHWTDGERASLDAMRARYTAEHGRMAPDADIRERAATIAAFAPDMCGRLAYLATLIESGRIVSDGPIVNLDAARHALASVV